MVGWGKRLGISLVSWIAGAILGAVVMVVQALITDTPPLARAGEPIIALASLVPVFMVASLPGWAVAVPLILAARSFCRWRFWAWLGAGTAIGPLLWLAWSLVTTKTRIDVTSMPAQCLVISFLGSLIYLRLLLRAQARAARRGERVRPAETEGLTAS
jgi:hypothetical protein